MPQKLARSTSTCLLASPGVACGSTYPLVSSNMTGKTPRNGGLLLGKSPINGLFSNKPCFIAGGYLLDSADVHCADTTHSDDFM